MRLVTAATACALLIAQLSSVEAAKFKVIYNFKGGSDGASPQADLLATGRLLYGTTVKGGTYGAGTLFSVDPKTGAEQILHSFGGSGDGAYPMAGLVRTGTRLYGTTVSGGSAEYGSVISFDLNSGTENVVHSFQSDADGDSPQSRLVKMNGLLYGTAYEGGNKQACNGWGCGTIYAIDPATNTETTLYTFQGGDGNGPYGGLTRSGGKLYGTTDEGGDGNAGVAYVFNPATNKLTDIHPFDHQGDATAASTKLTKLGSVLYGTGVEGGAIDQGAVYGLDHKSGAEVFTYSFTRDNGTYPEGSPAVLNGVIYATASIGGSADQGTVVAINPSDGSGKVLHNFTGGDGSNPWAGLIAVGDHLYGTTEGGGSANSGVVFEITP